MTDNATLVSEEDYFKLSGLLEQRIEMLERHRLAKKSPERQRSTLVEKLAADRASKAELAELNVQIDAIAGRSGRSL